MARPLVSEQAPESMAESNNTARLVLVDVSHSMAAEQRGVRLLERARPAAAAYLAERPGLQANLVLAGAAARPAFERLSSNSAALREELAKTQARPERLNVRAALDVASELLAKTEPDVRRELIILSDFQRSNWTAADFSALPADTHIQLDSVAARDTLPNLAVLRVAAQGRVEQDQELQLEVEVGNYAPSSRQVQVEVVLGPATYHMEGLCPPFEKTTLNKTVRVRGVGWQHGSARLLDVRDSLPADDVRPFAVEIHPRARFALITSQTADQRPSSSYYLERALAPLSSRPEQARERVQRLNPAAIDRDAVAAADVLVLDHPGKLSRDVLQLLVNLLQRGRSVFYVAAEPVDAVNLRIFAELAGSSLQMPVEFAPAPAGQHRQRLFLVDVRKDRAPFAVFGESLTALTNDLRFSTELVSRRRDNALLDEIAAGYSDQSACLMVTSCGAGSLAVLNADLAGSSLPASPMFVPLIGELMNQLLDPRRSQDEVACGEPMTVALPALAGPAAKLAVVGPDSEGGAAEFVEETAGLLWRSRTMAGPGVFRVTRDKQVIFALASAIPSEESDLRTLDPAVLQGRLAGGRSVRFRAVSADAETRDDWWTWLAFACAACLLGELVALKLYRT
jgi:hypothetical protein